MPTFGWFLRFRPAKLVSLTSFYGLWSEFISRSKVCACKITSICMQRLRCVPLCDVCHYLLTYVLIVSSSKQVHEAVHHKSVDEKAAITAHTSHDRPMYCDGQLQCSTNTARPRVVLSSTAVVIVTAPNLHSINTIISSNITTATCEPRTTSWRSILTVTVYEWTDKLAV